MTIIDDMGSQFRIKALENTFSLIWGFKIFRSELFCGQVEEEA
jgi:hypothetical protein